jgi:hypothetical protein
MSDIRELFEIEYADRFGMLPSEVKTARLGENSYNSLTIARCFRFFCAGFNKNVGPKLQFLGYSSKKSISEISHKGVMFITQIPNKSSIYEVFVNQPDITNTGE